MGQISVFMGISVYTMGMVDSFDWNPEDYHQLAVKDWIANPYLEKGGYFRPPFSIPTLSG